MARLFALVAAGLLTAAISPASASPITYAGTLSNGVTTAGSISQPNGNPQEPVGATYYSFFANAGSLVTIDVDRLSGPYDPAMFVFTGTYADTDQFGGFFDFGDPNFVAFGDDDTGPFVPGPFGDPLVSFNAPSTGFYSIAITNFASNGNPPYNFQITATGIVNQAVPEPATITLVGAMALGAFGLRRRLKSPAD